RGEFAEPIAFLVERGVGLLGAPGRIVHPTALRFGTLRVVGGRAIVIAHFRDAALLPELGQRFKKVSLVRDKAAEVLVGKLLGGKFADLAGDDSKSGIAIITGADDDFPGGISAKAG